MSTIQNVHRDLILPDNHTKSITFLPQDLPMEQFTNISEGYPSVQCLICAGTPLQNLCLRAVSATSHATHNIIEHKIN